MNKYLNIIIFIIALILTFGVNLNNSFSTNISSLLNDNDKRTYNISNKFNNSNSLLIAVEGFDKNSINKLRQIRKELSKIEYLSEKTTSKSTKLKEYNKKLFYYLNDLKYENHSDINVKNKLVDIKNAIMQQNAYYNISKSDPLKIFKKEAITNKLDIKNGEVVIGKFGYLMILNINEDNTSKENIYNELNTALSKYDNIKYFSPIFYYVENAKAIQEDVRTIIILSTIMLSLLYLYILNNYYLFINTAMALVSSVLLSKIIILNIFEEPSIITLAFAISVTTISIDYMFHHYFHREYDKKSKFNKDVFYGFLTTIIAFIFIALIDFALIRQISIFTIVSLSIAYIHFALIFPHLNIKYVEQKYLFDEFRFKIRSIYFVIISIIIIVLSYFYVDFNTNIMSLNYKNTKLINDEKFFKDGLNITNNSMIIISADNIGNLIKHAKTIKDIDTKSMIPISKLLLKDEYIIKKKRLEEFNFNELKIKLNYEANKLGFSNGFFKNSYTLNINEMNILNYDLKILKEFELDVIKLNNKFMIYAMINTEKLDETLNYDFVKLANMRLLFEKSVEEVYDELLLYGTLSFLSIILMLIFINKKKFFDSFLYLIFPLSLILLYGFYTPLNIMNVFMLLIIIAIGIDYGIYMSNKNKQTKYSILYSVISTFSGFGVLIVSNINSLYSIGITAIIGIIGIVILLLFKADVIK